MELAVKTLLAFCIGIAAMAGLQTYWMSSIRQELRSNHVALPQVEMKPIPQFDAAKFSAAINPKIDPNIGKDAWQGTINRQINQSINAGRMVPLPRSFPGVPRY